MDLAGVHHDDVANLGFDLTDRAPRPLRAETMIPRPNWSWEWRGKAWPEVRVIASMPGIAERCCST
jgi:hypothetical protein